MKNIHCINNKFFIEIKNNKAFENFKVFEYDEEQIKKKVNLKKVAKTDRLYKDYINLSFVYQFGGLLLDGNFEILENIDNLFQNDMFLSYITENKITTKIIYSKEKKNEKIEKILKVIEEGNCESIDEAISKALNIDTFKKINTTVKIDEKSYIYSYDYFFPLDYEKCGKNFSEKTKMIFFDSMSLSKKNRLRLKLFRKLGAPGYIYFMGTFNKLRVTLGSKKYALMQKLGKVDISYEAQKKSIIKACNIIESYKSNRPDYVIIHNPRWMGVTSATKELFENLVPLEEISKRKDAKNIAKKIVELGVNQVIFSAFADGWSWVAIELKRLNPNIKIKSFWHGSHSQVIEKINWRTNVNIINLHKKGIIDVFGTCKESLLNFYNSQGYNTAFLDNTVIIPDELKKKILNSSSKVMLKSKYEECVLKIGMYAAGTDWRKNMYTQLAATALFEKVIVDSVPLKFESELFASHLNINIDGIKKGVKREDLLARLANNDINIYVTFSECAPMLPIESLEMGTICLMGNNHHYFDDSIELKKYLVVDREDDMMEIANKIKYALANKEKIFELYKIWKKEHDVISKKSVEAFLKM